MKFSGELKFPEIDHPGVPVTFLIEGPQAELVVEGESLGRWSLYDVHARRLVASAFQIDLDGTEVTFVADDPVDFAYRGVEHMAETWASIKSKRIANRTIAVRKSRRGTSPSRIEDMKAAMVSNLEEQDVPRQIAGEVAMPDLSAAETPAPDVEAADDWDKRDQVASIPVVGSDVEEEAAAEPVEAETVAEAFPETALETDPEQHRTAAPDVLSAPERTDLERQLEEERRLLAEERAKLEEERRLAEQREADRIEAYRLEMQRLEAEREALRLREEVARHEASADLQPEPEPDMEPEPEPDMEPEPEPDMEPEPEPDIEPEPEVEHPSEAVVASRPGVVDLNDLEEPITDGVPPEEDDETVPPATDEEERPPRASPTVPSTRPPAQREQEPEPAMAGAAKERGGLMGAVRAAFKTSPKDHDHQFIEAPGGIGITRYVCEECGYVSISA